MDGIIRQAQQRDGEETVAISAIRPASLRSLLEKAGLILARNLGDEYSPGDTYEAEALSRIA